jgi:hypothetical protein
VAIVGGEYSIGCTATFTSAPGTITNGQTICVRHTASGMAGGAMTTTLTVGGVSVTFSSTTAASNVAAMVASYYRTILRREADAGGQAYWEGEASRMQSLGANVNETWYSMAGAFFTSAEYLSFNRDDTGFATDLYNTFFNRAPDAGGLAYWTGQLAQGMPREVVLVSFMFSPEFVNYTQAIFGNTAVRKEIDTVVDFYRGLLARLPDTAGFDFWVQRFRNAQCLGSSVTTAEAESISSKFTQSPEYVARARTNAQYVGDLYNAFLRRGGDLAGVQFWIDQIAKGTMTREQLRRQFVISPEFQGRVSAVIAQGCIDPKMKAQIFIGGAWLFTFWSPSLESISTDTYTFSSVSPTPDANGDYSASGVSASASPVTGGYASASGNWHVLAPGKDFDRLFAITFTDMNYVLGCYYEISPPGSTNLGKCNTMGGHRSPEM